MKPLRSITGFFRAIGKGIAGAARLLTVRIYAFAILLIVVWTGYTAVAFLVRSVFTPVRVPAQFLDRRAPMTLDRLRTGNALTAALPAPPAVLGHYHGVDRGFQSDLHNGCATSGCHSPLPHTKRKEVRAFTNFHANFLTCGMCHDARVKSPLQATWISTEDGQPQEAPALLQLMRLLEVDAEKVQTAPDEVHAEIVGLLSKTVRTIGGDASLDYLRIEIDTSEPGSPVWRHAVAQLAAELPEHARGEYAAKLAPKETDEALDERVRHMKNWTDRYFAAAPASAQRDKAYQDIHAAINAKPDACLTCHSNEPSRLDFDSLGYPPKRAALLHDTPIARMIQQIREGQPFHLPQLLEGKDGH